MKQKNRLVKLCYFFLTIIIAALSVFLLFKLIDPCYRCASNGSLSQSNLVILSLAALTDAINPCALAVLMILLEGLILLKKGVLKVGLAFVFGIFFSYLLIGLGIISGLSFINNIELFHKIIAIIAITVGIFNVKDFFFYGQFFHMEIPVKWRPKMGTIIQKATQPILAILIGFLISAFELPCTGGPYLFALGLLKGKLLILPYLIYYNLLFVLPLLIIIFAVHFSYLKIEKTEVWRKKNTKLLHLIAGIVMIGIGVWLYLA